MNKIIEKLPSSILIFLVLSLIIGCEIGQKAVTPEEQVNPVPKNLIMTSRTTDSISIGWSMVKNASSYNIYMNSNPDLTFDLVTHTSNSQATVDGLTENTVYYLRVKSVVNGSESAFSDYIKIYTAINRPVLQFKDVTSVQATLYWNSVPNATGYFLYRSDFNNTSYDIEDNYIQFNQGTYEFTDVDLATDKSYYYKITAFNDNTESNFSEEIKVTASMMTPTGFKIVNEDESSILLQWDAKDSQDVTGFEIYRSINNEYNFQLLTKTTDVLYRNSGLERGRRYYYKIRSYKGTKYSEFSGILQGITNPLPPNYAGTRTTFFDNIGETAVSLIWDNPGGFADGLRIYKSETPLDDSQSFTPYLLLERLGWDSEYLIDNTSIIQNKYYYYYVSSFTRYLNNDGFETGKKEGFFMEGGELKVFKARTLPPIPGNFEIDYGRTSGNRVTFTWSTPVPVAVLPEYYHYFLTKRKSSGTWDTTPVEITDQGETSYTLHLEPATQYYFMMYTEANYTDESVWVKKNSNNTSILSHRTTIDAPTNLTATRNKLAAINLNWTAVNIPGYIIYYNIYRNGAYLGNSTTNSYSDTTFGINTGYTYYVTSYLSTDSSVESIASNTTPSITATFPAPTMYALTQNGCASINVSWSAADAGVPVTYYLERSTDGGGSWGYLTTTDTSYNDYDLVIGTEYRYRVRAYLTNRDSITSVSSNVEVEYFNFPTPSFTATSSTMTTITLTLGKITGAAGYQIQRIDPAETTDIGDPANWIDDGLTKNTTYSYRIRAYKTDAGGTHYSAWSDPATSVTTKNL